MPLALVSIALACILGTVLAEPLGFDERMLALTGLVMLAASVASRQFKPPQIRLVLLLALVLSYANASWHMWKSPQIEASRTARYTGVVLSVDATQSNLYEAIILLDRGLHVRAALPTTPQIGARVLVRGRLEPFDDARNPGETSERVREAASGIDGRLASAHILKVIDTRDTRASVVVARAHRWALDQLRERLGEPDAAIVAGELWGERGDLAPDLRAEFQETGTVHILITAGLHVGLLAALVVLACGALRFPRTAGCALAIALVWGFALWSGANLPALRAATMISMALLARACGRAALSWNTLAAAAIVICGLMPASVATPSFWLSFTCVAAIFACAPFFERLLERVPALPARAREAIVLTLATQLGTWPITAAVFLQFSWYGLAANLAIVPLVPATMLLGAGQLALAWCAPLAQACANLNGWLLAWMLGVVHLLSTLPSSTVPMTPAPTWCIAAYEAALLAFVPLLRRGAATLAVALLLTATNLVVLPPRSITHDLRITMIDVGQADSILIQTPAGHAILVDAGGRLERGPQTNQSSAERVGEQIVVPLLLRYGIHHLDAVILSHPHGDHVGGCSPVLRKIRVEQIADGGQVYGGHAYHDCLDTAKAQHVPIVQPRAGMEWRTDDSVVLHFIGPQLPFISGKNAINDNSVAFILTYRNFKMLFTGDAGNAAERRFLDEGIDLHTDVLKVGHHGSAYSSSPEFIAAVHPRYAIISVGRHNVFGHPAPSTIETLQRIGATSYRTDQNAAITIVTNGTTLIARTACECLRF